MLLGRFPRATDTIGEIDGMGTSWGAEYWQPSSTQFGTKWVPNILDNFLDATGLTGQQRKQDVGLIFWVSCLQLAFSLLPIVVSCVEKCCSEEGTNKKTAAAGSSNTFFTMLIGAFGIMAVKFDCKELLVTVVIMSMICLLLSGVYLLIVLCGFGLFCCGAEGCCERVWGLFALILAVVWILVASLLNLILVIKGWPICFGESIEDTVGN